MVADPLASTFSSQSALSPYGSAMTNPSSIGIADSDVEYERPDVHPTWWTTEADVPGPPADLMARGLIARPRLRTLFTTSGDFARIPVTNTIPVSDTTSTKLPAALVRAVRTTNSSL